MADATAVFAVPLGGSVRSLLEEISDVLIEDSDVARIVRERLDATCPKALRSMRVRPGAFGEGAPGLEAIVDGLLGAGSYAFLRNQPVALRMLGVLAAGAVLGGVAVRLVVQSGGVEVFGREIVEEWSKALGEGWWKTSGEKGKKVVKWQDELGRLMVQLGDELAREEIEEEEGSGSVKRKLRKERDKKRKEDEKKLDEGERVMRHDEVKKAVVKEMERSGEGKIEEKVSAAVGVV